MMNVVSVMVTTPVAQIVPAYQMAELKKMNVVYVVVVVLLQTAVYVPMMNM